MGIAEVTAGQRTGGFLVQSVTTIALRSGIRPVLCPDAVSGWVKIGLI